MINPLHILTGWFRSQIYAPERIKKLSEERLKVCIDCPYAVEKSFLKIREDGEHQEKTKACDLCGCPIQEKTLVESEKCPENLWEK